MPLPDSAGRAGESERLAAVRRRAQPGTHPRPSLSHGDAILDERGVAHATASASVPSLAARSLRFRRTRVSTPARAASSCGSTRTCPRSFEACGGLAVTTADSGLAVADLRHDEVRTMPCVARVGKGRQEAALASLAGFAAGGLSGSPSEENRSRKL
jgi:hypothetical protein